MVEILWKPYGVRLYEISAQVLIPESEKEPQGSFSSAKQAAAFPILEEPPLQSQVAKIQIFTR